MRFDVRKLAVLLLLAAMPAAQAQLWSGTAAVEVRAEDQRGHALAGARVLLQNTSLTPKDGPPPVETDSRGRANVGGLAEGPWHLEVSHDGFMTYMAEINVGRGRPELVEATQYRVPGGGTTLMSVRISRGTPGPAAARASAPPPPRPEPVAPAPAPVPKAQPAPAAPQPPKPQPQEAPAPAVPQPQPVPAPPPAPTPQPAAPAPVQPQAVPSPAPPAPQPPPPPPAETTRLRTAKDRNCFECQPGESALSIDWPAVPGGSGCGDIAPQLKGGEVPPGLPPGCHVLRVALPAGARFTAFRYEVQAGGDSLDCATGKDCPQGTGRWPIDPVLVRDPKGTVVLAPFESGAAAGARAVLTVYFTDRKR